MAFIDEVQKPIVVTWNSFKTDEQGFTHAGRRRACRCSGRFATASPPCAPSPATRRRRRRSGPARPCRRRLPTAAAAALADAGGTGAAPLGADASRRLLEAFGVPLAGEGLAHSAAEAARLAGAIGFPVVMKIASPDFPHKSDAGLVRLVGGLGGRGQGRLRRAGRAGHAGQAPRPASRVSRSRSRSSGGTEMIVGRHPRPGVRARRPRGHGRGVRRDPEGRGRAAPAHRPARRPGDGRRACAATRCSPGRAGASRGRCEGARRRGPRRGPPGRRRAGTGWSSSTSTPWSSGARARWPSTPSWSTAG